MQNLQNYTKFLYFKEIGRNFFFTLFCNPYRMLSPLTQNVNWTYIRRPIGLQDFSWTSYVRPYYVLCPGDWDLFYAFATSFKHWKDWNVDYFWDHSLITPTKFSKKTQHFLPPILTRACAYQAVRNVSFSKRKTEIFSNVINEWSLLNCDWWQMV